MLAPDARGTALSRGVRLTNLGAFCAAMLVLSARFVSDLRLGERALDRAHAETRALVHSLLPVSIAERLLGGEKRIADRHDEVTILFADLVGFTVLSERTEPAAMVALLHDVFTRFDAIVAARGAEKIKTIGDAYMAVAGAPKRVDDHAASIARVALEMVDAVREVRDATGYDIAIRVGVESGSVVAGVLGTDKLLYDLWGDSVNTASRMESHGVPGRVQIGEATRALLGDAFELEERGTIDIKGKGPRRTWFLIGERGP